MVEGDAPHGKGVTGFLKGETAGLPNWAWILVITVGIAAAIVVPKFLNRGQTQDTSGTSSGQEGIGLAIDPTNGLPYAVSGLVPAGGAAGSNGGVPIIQPAQVTDLSSVNSLLQKILNNQTRQRPPATGQQAVTRSNWSGEGSAAQLPIWKSPQVDWSQTVGGIPKDTAVTIGQPVFGAEGKIYFPVAYKGKQGYIASWDLGNLAPSVQNQTSNWPGDTTQQRIV